MISASEKLKGHLAAATAVIIWGSTFVSTKVLLRDFSPVEILLVRFLIGYFVLWMICPKRLKLQNIRTEILFLIAGFTGIVACALSFLIWAYATARIGAVSTNLYFYVQPAVTILFSMVILQERMTWKGWLGTALTFGGLLISQQSEKH